MADAADQVTADDERAMELLERQRQEQAALEARIAASMHAHDPSSPQYCNDCGEQIDPDRLMAQPRASRCTACAGAYERNMRARWPW